MKKIILLVFVLSILTTSQLLAKAGDRNYIWDIGFNINYPLTLSMPILLLSEEEQEHGGKMETGFMLQFEPGFDGAKLQLGYIINPFIYEWPVLWYIKGSLLRTWGEPIDLGPNQTYAGIEAELYYGPFIFNIGYYGHIVGDDSDHSKFLSYGIGMVFRDF